MARTTAALVRGINSDIEADQSLTPFINAASFLIDKAVAPALQSDGVTPFYSDDELRLIETWLAAHFQCIDLAKSKRVRVGPLLDETQSKVDLGLNVTHYGQQAMLLDVKGGLLALNDPTGSAAHKPTLQLKVGWAGTNPSDVKSRRRT